MRKLLLLAVFVVTWKTYEAHEVMTAGYITSYIGVGVQPKRTEEANCQIFEANQRKEFDTEAEAKKFAETVAQDRKVWDVERWTMEKTK